MTRHVHRVPVFLTAIAATAMTLLVAPSTLWALKLPAAIIRFEINGTAGDAGVQFFLDGPGWKSCNISRPDGNHLVTVTATVSANGSPGTNGLTELFIESAEPDFEAQPLPDLLALFPAGNYPYECLTTDDKTLKSVAKLTNKLPATPTVIGFVDGKVQWNHVTGPFVLDGDVFGDPTVAVIAYEVIVERLSDGRKFSITLPANNGVNFVTVPPEFITPNTDYRGEVLAIEQSGNQTIAEFEFSTPH